VHPSVNLVLRVPQKADTGFASQWARARARVCVHALAHPGGTFLLVAGGPNAPPTRYSGGRVGGPWS
jgi:hypothetical protein